MGKSFIASIFLFAVCSLSAQDSSLRITNNKHPKTVFAEVGGTGVTYSIHYDQRFGKTNAIGFRTGIGYANLPDGNLTTLPISSNFFLGKQNALEIGIGGLLTIPRYTKTYPINQTDTGYIQFCGCVYNDDNWTILSVEDSKTRFWLASTIGYRYQSSNNGFLFRIGLSPLIPISKLRNRNVAASILPYLSLGYSF